MKHVVEENVANRTVSVRRRCDEDKLRKKLAKGAGKAQMSRRRGAGGGVSGGGSRVDSGASARALLEPAAPHWRTPFDSRPPPQAHL